MIGYLDRVMVRRRRESVPRKVHTLVSIALDSDNIVDDHDFDYSVAKTVRV